MPFAGVGRLIAGGLKQFPHRLALQALFGKLGVQRRAGDEYGK